MHEHPRCPDTPPPLWGQYLLLVALTMLVAWIVSAVAALLWR